MPKRPRQNISYFISLLGYCCEWRFFSLYKQTCLIAARLGVSDRAVRYRKALWRAGSLRCTGCPRCVKVAEARATSE